MLKRLNHLELDQLLETIADTYHLQVPQQLADGTRQLAPFDSGRLALAGAPLQRKPTSYFFPQTELLVTIGADAEIYLPEAPTRPLALFGLDRADLRGIAFLDRFFGAPPADDRYLQKRGSALLIGLTGDTGREQEFLPLAGGDCDLELIGATAGWLAMGYSALGKMLLRTFSDGDSEELRQLQQRSALHPDQYALLQQASELLLNDRVPDEFWAEIAARCIICTGCNLVCPTCNCFCVQDRCSAAGTERSRVWDSCQFDAFMREASGHNPLGTEALRTRRRIHHKLAADVQRWGEIGCVACGRCDRACPTGIGMLSVATELVTRYQGRT